LRGSFKLRPGGSQYFVQQRHRFNPYPVSILFKPYPAPVLLEKVESFHNGDEKSSMVQTSPPKAPLEIHVRFTGSLLTNEKLATIGIDLLLAPSVLESHIGVED
jgi:hypothetical protein